jgi:hypothetical protein
MFDSIEDQMKNTAMSGSSSKEKWTRYAVITALSVVAVVGLVVVVQFAK